MHNPIQSLFCLSITLVLAISILGLTATQNTRIKRTLISQKAAKCINEKQDSYRTSESCSIYQSQFRVSFFQQVWDQISKKNCSRHRRYVIHESACSGQEASKVSAARTSNEEGPLLSLLPAILLPNSSQSLSCCSFGLN